MTKELKPLYQFWQPRFWPMWLGLALLRVVVWLPQSWRMATGRFLGRRIEKLAGKRRKVAARNLAICFPELNDHDRELLVRHHFESIGMGVIELGIAWWSRDDYMDKIVTLNGLDNLQAALKQGNGVVLLSGHFATTEMAGRPLRHRVPPMAAMYRPSNNPLTDQLMRRCRGKSIADLITKTSVRRLLKVLKEGRIVWYAADQAYNRKGTVIVPFFGEPASTNTSVSQITKLSKAPVVPFFPIRMDNGRHYSVDILPALENFPSGDDAADAIRLNELLETYIRKAPEQYYWVHRRFKGRPDEYPDPYD
jgi:KDO2-lipid IV(A) lauroyltransferase